MPLLIGSITGSSYLFWFVFTNIWAIFNETFYPNRGKAVRTKGYTERVVPNYNFGVFRSHFRLSPETYEELIIRFTFSGRHVERFGLTFPALIE